MAPFVDERLTRRLQFDFIDVSTSPVGRRWAEIDPHVLGGFEDGFDRSSQYSDLRGA